MPFQPPSSPALLIRGAALALALWLPACASQTPNEVPAAQQSAAPAAEPAPGQAASAASPAAATAAAAAPVAKRLEPHEINGQCWMKADRTGGSLEAKAKFVEKCAADMTKAQAGQ